MALYSNLIGHNLEKFGMITVLDATFYDVATGVPLIHFDTLKMSNISSEGQQKEIRGGQGAELLLTYDFGRTANIEVTDALASMYSLEYLWGGTIDRTATFDYLKRKEGVVITNTLSAVISASATIGTVAGSGAGPFTATITVGTGEGNNYAVGNILSATAGSPGTLGTGVVTVVSKTANTINVSSTGAMTAGSITNIKRKVYQIAINSQMPDLKGKGSTSTTFKGNVGTRLLDFQITDITNGAQLAQAVVAINSELSLTSAITYYTVTADTAVDHTHELVLTNLDFPPIVKMVGDSFLLDQDTGRKIAMQIEIPRFKLDTNFSFTLEGEGDASVFDFSGVALSDNGNILIMRTLGVI
jgi:hypothetical protein